MTRKVENTLEPLMFESVVHFEFQNELNGSLDLVLEKLGELQKEHDSKLFVKCAYYGHNGEYDVIVYKMVQETPEQLAKRQAAHDRKEAKRIERLEANYEKLKKVLQK